MFEGQTGILHGAEKTKFVDDALTEVSYAEKTWSVEQSVRDLFQNHLDAQVRRQVSDAIEKLVNNLAEIETLQEDKEMRKVVYYFLNAKGSISPDAEMEMLREMSRCIKKYSSKSLSEVEEVVMSRVEKVSFDPPEFKFIVVDKMHKEGKREVNVGEMAKMLEKMPGSNEDFRWSIVGLKMADKGDGYDVSLKSVYDSDKRGAVDQVGKYGEGAKVSDAFLVKNGYSVSQKSVYKIKGEDGFVAWKARPRLSDDGGLLIQGVTVKAKGEVSTGSSTVIQFPENEDTNLFF